MARPAQTNHTSGYQSSGFTQWYNSIPICTRIIITGTISFTLLSYTSVIPAHSMFLYWPLVWKKLQIWRLVTGFFLQSMSLGSILSTVFFYRESILLETQVFSGRSADYAWFLIICMSISSMLCSIKPVFFLFPSIYLSVLMLWSIYNESQIVNFIFGLRFPARYMPYVVIAFQFFADGGAIPYNMVFGGIAARIYYFLASELPAQGGLNYVRTPQLFYTIFGGTQPVDIPTGSSNNYGSHIGSQPSITRLMPGNSYSWGRGRRLGS